MNNEETKKTKVKALVQVSAASQIRAGIAPELKQRIEVDLATLSQAQRDVFAVLYDPADASIREAKIEERDEADAGRVSALSAVVMLDHPADVVAYLDSVLDGSAKAKARAAERGQKEREALLAWAHQSARDLFEGLEEGLISLGVVREEWEKWTREKLGFVETSDHAGLTSWVDRPFEGWAERMEEINYMGRDELREYRAAGAVLKEHGFELRRARFFRLMERSGRNDDPARLFVFDAVDGAGLAVECGKVF